MTTGILDNCINVVLFEVWSEKDLVTEEISTANRLILNMTSRNYLKMGCHELQLTCKQFSQKVMISYIKKQSKVLLYGYRNSIQPIRVRPNLFEKHWQDISYEISWEKIGRKIDILNIRRGSLLAPHILEIVRTTIRSLKIPRVIRRTTKNTMTNRKRTKEQTTIYKTYP